MVTGVESFSKDQLKHTKAVEKVVLPDKIIIKRRRYELTC